MDVYKHPSLLVPRTDIHYSFVYFLAIVFSYHTLLVGYVISSFVSPWLSPAMIGIYHGSAAIVTIILFLAVSPIVRKIGNVLLGISAMSISIIALLVTAIASNVSTVLIALFIYLAVHPLVYFVIDIFSETLIGDKESGTGAKRGLTLAFMSFAAMCAPLTMSAIMTDTSDFTQLFFASAGVGLLFIAVVIGIFRRFYDPVYAPMHYKTAFTVFRHNQNLRTVAICHLILQIFFSWTMIYIPLYLITVAGLSIAEVGFVISAGLLSYSIFEYPIGIIADKYFGEQEMMTIGFVILAITTSCIGFMMSAPLVAWMILMFVNRFGASLVEVTTESYFFKQVSGEDSSLLSMFRLLRPMANVIGALIGTILLSLVSFPFFFIVAGSILIVGVFMPRYLIDTK